MRMLCGKTQHFALGLAPKILPRAAPAAKSDVPTSANIAPGRKSRPQTPAQISKNTTSPRRGLKIDSSGSQLLLFSAIYSYSVTLTQLLYCQLFLPSGILLSATCTPSPLYSQLPAPSYSTLSYAAVGSPDSQPVYCVGEQKFVHRKFSS